MEIDLLGKNRPRNLTINKIRSSKYSQFIIVFSDKTWNSLLNLQITDNIHI